MYGGTKSELERLVADAEKLTGQALDPSKFSDIITAIHAVQENLGITGTTAKEASTTIEGSVNAMKAAWSNLTTGIADDNADLSGLIDNFVETASIAVANILPRITQILTGMSAAIQQIAPILAQQLPALIGSILPAMTTAGAQLLAALIAGLVAALPQLLAAIPQIFAAIYNGFVSAAPQMAEAGGQLLQMLLDGLRNGIPNIAGVVPDMVNGFVSYLTNNISAILQAGVEVVNALADGILDAIPNLIDSLPEIITAIVEFVASALPDILQSGIDILLSLVSGIIETIPELVSRIPEIITAFTSTVASNLPQILQSGVDLLIQFADGILSEIPNLVGKLPEIINAIISGIGALMDGIINVGKSIIEGLWKGIGDAKDWLIGKIQNLCTDALGAIKDFFGIHSPSRVMRDQIGLMIARGMALGIKKGEREVLSVAYRLNDKLLDAEQELNDKLSAMEQEERDRRAAVELADHQRKIKEKYAELGKTEKSERQKIQDEIAKLEADWNEKQLQAQYDAEKEKLQAQIDTMKKFRDEYEKALDEIQDAQNDMAGKLADYGELFKSVEKNGREFFELGDLQKDIDAINRYGDALENLKARGVSDSLLDEITSMGVEEATAYTERLLGMTDEQYAKYMALWEQKQAAAKQVASQFYRDEMDALGKEFVDKIPEELGEVKDEMRDIGVMGIQGMIDGMYSKSGALWNAAASIVSQAIAAMRRAADIHSPSRKTAELVGVPFAQGVGVGFEKAYPGVMERMRTAFDASMAQTSAQLQSAAGGHGSSVTREVNNNTTTVDRILRIEVTGEDGEFVRWLRNKIKTEDDRVGPALA